jgi:hypothetical protein
MILIRLNWHGLPAPQFFVAAVAAPLLLLQRAVCPDSALHQQPAMALIVREVLTALIAIMPQRHAFWDSMTVPDAL